MNTANQVKGEALTYKTAIDGSKNKQLHRLDGSGFTKTEREIELDADLHYLRQFDHIPVYPHSRMKHDGEEKWMASS